MKNVVVLNSATAPEDQLRESFSFPDVHLSIHNKPTPEQLPELLRDAEVVMVDLAIKLEAELIKSLSHLKCIIALSTGVNNIDGMTAAARNIPVCNAPGYAAESVAETVFTMAVALRAQILQRFIETRRWEDGESVPPELMSPENLHGLVMGVVGFGENNRAVVKRARQQGMTLMANTKNPDKYRDAHRDITFTDLASVFQASDIVSLSVPADSSTNSLVNADVLGSLNRTPILINTGRANAIDHDAVIAALRDGRLNGFGTDVPPVEPMPADHPLLSAPNTLVWPHISNKRLYAVANLMRMSRENLEGYLRGERRNAVNLH